MSERRNRWRRWSVVVSIATLSVVAACGSDDGESDRTPSGDDTSATVDVSPDGVEPDKVILASVLLAVGDVDVALAEGLVTADEVDQAASALEDGTLDVWMDRAVLGD